jgi:hypothetical protein
VDVEPRASTQAETRRRRSRGLAAEAERAGGSASTVNDAWRAREGRTGRAKGEGGERKVAALRDGRGRRLSVETVCRSVVESWSANGLAREWVLPKGGEAFAEQRQAAGSQGQQRNNNGTKYPTVRARAGAAPAYVLAFHPSPSIQARCFFSPSCFGRFCGTRPPSTLWAREGASLHHSGATNAAPQPKDRTIPRQRPCVRPREAFCRH